MNIDQDILPDLTGYWVCQIQDFVAVVVHHTVPVAVVHQGMAVVHMLAAGHRVVAVVGSLHQLVDKHTHHH